MGVLVMRCANHELSAMTDKEEIYKGKTGGIQDRESRSSERQLNKKPKRVPNFGKAALGDRIRLPGKWISSNSPCVRSKRGQIAKALREIKQATIAERRPE